LLAVSVHTLPSPQRAPRHATPMVVDPVNPSVDTESSTAATTSLSASHSAGRRAKTRAIAIGEHRAAQHHNAGRAISG